MSNFAMPVSKNDDLNSSSNPLHVQVEETTGTNVHDYNTANVNGNGTTNNHDYTIVGTSFKLRGVLLSSESKFEAKVQVGPLATLVDKAVGKVNTAQMSFFISFDPPVIVPATGTGTIRVIRKRLQNGADDVHTTIMGEDLA